MRSFVSVGVLVLSGIPLLSFAGSESTSNATPVFATGTPSSFFWGDFDGDGLADAYVVAPSGQARLLRNAGDGGFTDVTAVFGTAMFCVYVDCGVRKHDPHPRRMQLMAMYCFLSVVQVVIALLANNETFRVVNTCSVALLAMHFALAK